MLIKENLNYKPVVLTVKEIKLDPVPNIFNSGQTCKNFLNIYLLVLLYNIIIVIKIYNIILGIRLVISEWINGDSSKIRKVYSSDVQDVRRTASDVTISLTQITQVLGDVKVECYNKHKMKKKV